MKRFLAMAVIAMATTLGSSETAQAQWGRVGGRGYTISIGGGRGLGVSYSRYSGFNRGFNRGISYGRGYGYHPGYYRAPVYVGRPYYGGGGYYGGRVYYGRGGYCGW